MAKKIKVDGKCPYCNTKNKLEYCTLQDVDGTILREHILMCMECLCIDYLDKNIELRKINNRRYKIVG